MPAQDQTNRNSGNSYLMLFNKAQENFDQVCVEHRNNAFCKKVRRKQNKAVK